MDQYAVGDVVWIKIPKYPWWPAKVVPKDECPTIYTGNKPAVYVKFLNEEYFECVTDDKKIKPFDFEGKNKLVEQGSEAADKKNLRLEFDGAISIALETCQQAPTKCNDNVKILQTQQSTEKCDTQTVSDSNETRQTEKQDEIQTQTKGNSKVNKVLFRNEVINSELSNCCKEENRDGRSGTEDRRDQVKLKALNNLISYSKRKWKLNDDKTKDINTTERKRLKINANDDSEKKNQKTKKRGSVKLTSSENRNSEIRNSENKNSENKIIDNSSYTEEACNTETEHKIKNENYLDDSWNLPTPDSDRTTSVCRTILSTNRLSFDPNLSKDMCDEDEDNSDETDSDVDFPEGLSPIVGEYPISEKDIIWVSWRKYPFWPAYVSKIYRKRRHITKISVMFLGKRDEIPKILTLRYRPKKMLHFVHRDKDEFIRIGKSQEDANIKRNFTEAIELAEDYLNKKALGLLKTSELAFLFENLDENQIEHINEENWEHSDTCDDENSSFKSCTDKHNYTDTLIDKEQPVLDIMDGLSKKEQEMQLKSKQKQKDLVSFIMSEKMKTFLFDIRTGKRKSERHEKFFSRRTKVRQSLRYTGFGPIANEEQQEEIIATFIKWLIECDSYGEKSLPDAGYVMDVWIPEALVHALTQVKTYSRSVAWKRIDSGSGFF